MPMEVKFRFTDLAFFHLAYNDLSVVKLPSYLTNLPSTDRNRLRSIIRQPSYLSDHQSSDLPNPGQRRMNRHDQFSLKCAVDPKSVPFRNGFFFRTHLEWNELPTDLKSIGDPYSFTTGLKKYLWSVALPNLSDENESLN